MKMTILPQTTKKKAIFEIGDYFLKKGGKLRQIIRTNEPSKCVIVDPFNGVQTFSSDDNIDCYDLTDFMEKYVKQNGEIQKVVVSELIVKETNEFLE